MAPGEWLRDAWFDIPDGQGSPFKGPSLEKTEVAYEVTEWSLAHMGITIVRANFPNMAVCDKLSSPNNFPIGSRAIAAWRSVTSKCAAHYAAFSGGAIFSAGIGRYGPEIPQQAEESDHIGRERFRGLQSYADAIAELREVGQSAIGLIWGTYFPEIVDISDHRQAEQPVIQEGYDSAKAGIAQYRSCRSEHEIFGSVTVHRVAMRVLQGFYCVAGVRWVGRKPSVS